MENLEDNIEKRNAYACCHFLFSRNVNGTIQDMQELNSPCHKQAQQMSAYYMFTLLVRILVILVKPALEQRARMGKWR